MISSHWEHGKDTDSWTRPERLDQPFNVLKSALNPILCLILKTTPWGWYDDNTVKFKCLCHCQSC